MNPVSLKVHNQAVHSSLEKGDIVRFPRGIYDHFGIYNGGGKIIHMDKDKENKIIVREDEFDKVCKNSKAEKCNYLDDICRPKNPLEIIAYAESKIGKDGYNLLTNNCENFATSCRYGKSYSQQAVAGIGIFTSIILVLLAIISVVIMIVVLTRRDLQMRSKKGNSIGGRVSVCMVED